MTRRGRVKQSLALEKRSKVQHRNSEVLHGIVLHGLAAAYLAARKKHGIWAPEAARAAADFWVAYLRISDIGLADEWQKFYENARKEARQNAKKRAEVE